MAAKEIKINNDINIKKEKTYGGDKCSSVYRRHACFIDYFYGYNCQRIAHNLYPPHLWENENKVLLDNELVSPRTKLDQYTN